MNQWDTSLAHTLTAKELLMWTFKGNPSVTVIDLQTKASSEKEAGDRALERVTQGAVRLGFHLDATLKEVRELDEDGKGLSS